MHNYILYFICIFYNLKIEQNMDNFLQALTFIGYTVKKYYAVPGYIEKWNLVIDVHDCGVTDLPFTLIKNLISVMSIKFPSSVDHIFILNPSMSLRFAWSMLECNYITEISLYII